MYRKFKRKNNNEKSFLERICDPPAWTLVLAFSTLFTAVALSVVALIMERGRTPLAVFFYTVSALSLVYCVLLSVRTFGKLGEKMSKAADRYAFTRNIKADYEFRTLVFSVVAFLFNITYAVSLCVIAMNSGTLWYGVLAVYYILLTSARGGIMMEKRRLERRFGGNSTRLYRERLKIYLFCGVMLLSLTVALAAAVVQMVTVGKRLQSADVMFYVFAAFAVYRIVLAVQNFVKGKSQDLSIRAVDNLNFAAALVTLLSMQTVLLDVVASPLVASVLNGITGFLVCASIVAVGIYMIVFAKKEQGKAENAGTTTEQGERAEAEEKTDFSENR